MKYFIVSDIHSFYDELKAALSNAGFDRDNETHVFVSCGDLLDRGSQSSECLEFVNSIPMHRKILIRGNHEDLLEECIEREEFLSHDLHNGTLKTIYNLCGLNEDSFWFDSNYKKVFQRIKHCKPLYKYLNSLRDYAQVGNYIFVHGWVPSCTDTDWSSGNWKIARWYNGMEKWSNGCTLEGNTIVCGHWHCSWGNSKFHSNGTEWGTQANFNPFVDKGILAIDGCTAYSRHVNVVVLEI